MILYKTVMNDAIAEQVIEKSKFIGHVKHVKTREEAESFISEIKSTHKSATHNVPAYIIGAKAELQWTSDDGEPSGTSGGPMLHMIENEGIRNVAIVVTRYFGGIKLGTGGLVRAYTSTAKLVLNEAGICNVVEKSLLTFKLEYTYYGKLQNIAEQKGYEISRADFTSYIELDMECNSEQTDEAIGVLTELSNGTCSPDTIACKKILAKCKL